MELNDIRNDIIYSKNLIPIAQEERENNLFTFTQFCFWEDKLGFRFVQSNS